MPGALRPIQCRARGDARAVCPPEAQRARPRRVLSRKVTYAKEVCMIRVKVRSNESVEQMVRRFKKLCEKEGLTRDIKRNSYYEKPSERRRRKVRKSMKRIARES